MQVFKLYFQILRGRLGLVFMYLGIFVGVVVGIIVPNSVEKEKEGYVQSECKLTIFDQEGSVLSEGLAAYLNAIHERVEIADDEQETIQDELYNLNVDGVLCIKNGFEAAFLNGTTEDHMELFTIPDSMDGVLLTQHINEFLSVVNTYVNAGFSVEEAVDKTGVAMETSVEVSFTEEEVAEQASPISFFFKYLAWTFVAICVNVITGVLMAMDKKGVKERIQCSSYSFSRMNLEMIMGVVVTGVAMCAFISGIGMSVFGSEMASVSVLLYFLNALCITAVAMAIAFMVSKFDLQDQVVSMISNVVSLGMAFLCGVFVPLELMSEGIIKAAHFLPAYWYVRATEVIDAFQTGDGLELLTYMGIQILFAVAITCVGVVVANRKRQAS